VQSHIIISPQQQMWIIPLHVYQLCTYTVTVLHLDPTVQLHTNIAIYSANLLYTLHPQL